MESVTCERIFVRTILLRVRRVHYYYIIIYTHRIRTYIYISTHKETVFLFTFISPPFFFRNFSISLRAAFLSHTDK